MHIYLPVYVSLVFQCIMYVLNVLQEYACRCINVYVLYETCILYIVCMCMYMFVSPVSVCTEYIYCIVCMYSSCMHCMRYAYCLYVHVCVYITNICIYTMHCIHLFILNRLTVFLELKHRVHTHKYNTY
jgi:hypothetical protein